MPTPTAAVPKEPTNKNKLSPLVYQFTVQRIPSVIWFLQSVNLPGITLGEATQPTPFIDLPVTGDKLVYGELTMTFMVDEDLVAWTEIHDWMVGIGFPQSFEQHKAYTASGGTPAQEERLVYSDATLLIYNSARNLNFEVSFLDIFPTSLSSLQFNTAESDLTYLTGDVSFRFRDYSYVSK